MKDNEICPCCGESKAEEGKELCKKCATPNKEQSTSEEISFNKGYKLAQQHAKAEIEDLKEERDAYRNNRDIFSEHVDELIEINEWQAQQIEDMKCCGNCAEWSAFRASCGLSIYGVIVKCNNWKPRSK